MKPINRTAAAFVFAACMFTAGVGFAGAIMSQNETKKASSDSATSAQMMDGCVSTGCPAIIAPRGNLFKQSTVPVAVLAREYINGADLCSTAVKGLVKGRAGQCR